MTNLQYSKEYLLKDISDLNSELILKLDIDKYVQWLLNCKATTKSEKKERVLRLLEGRDKTFANYRWAIEEIFFKTRYWNSPTQEERDDLLFWRKTTLEWNSNFRRNYYGGSPLPDEIIREEECLRVIKIIKTTHRETMFEIKNGRVVEDYFGVGFIAGYIDYLQSLNESNPETKILSEKSQLDEKKIEQHMISSKRQNVPMSNRPPTHSYSLSDLSIPSKFFTSFKDTFLRGTEKADFNKLFSKHQLKDFKKIDWHGSIADLHHFIISLIAEKKQRFEIAAHCFTVKGNNITPEQIENNKARGKEFGEKIDKILPKK